MLKSIILLIIPTTSLLSCKQSNNSSPETVDIETMNSVRNYEYVDSSGHRILIHNSLPKSRLNYTDPNDKKFVYAVFWTQIKNETTNPIDLNIYFPTASFEFPRSSGNYMKILIPSDTITLDKAALPEYGLDVKSFLDTGFNKSFSLKRTINSKDSTGFYVVTVSNDGAGGTLRTGLSIKGQNLFYKLSLFNNSTPELALMDKKEINCGSFNLNNLFLKR